MVNLRYLLSKKKEVWMTDAEYIYTTMLGYNALSPLGKRELWLRIKKVVLFIWQHYKDLYRFGGDTLYAHSLKSTHVLLSTHPDIDAVELCVLHDALSCIPGIKETLVANFGERTVELLERFSALNKIRYVPQEDSKTDEEQRENLKKLFMVLASDLRVIVVKLATRLEGMESLTSFPRDKQIRIAKEVLEIYAPVASRLGIYNIKTRLEDLAYHILEPERYRIIKADLEEEIEQNENIIEECQQELYSLLQEHRIKGKVFGRIKSVYSIAMKLQLKNREHVSQLYDIFALRVIVPTKEDCYRVFGYIHEKTFPIAARIKDYISLPKMNNYQSLHTTVTGLYSKNPDRPVEIQIRTAWMDEIAEFGFAAHADYKEQRKEDDYLWKRRIADLKKNFLDQKQTSGLVSTNLSDDAQQVLVFSETGIVKVLPRGATLLDYAYSLGDETGNHCVRGYVNGLEVPLFYGLHSGDELRVEVHPDRNPSGIWLLYVTTPRAKTAIDLYFKTQKDKKMTLKERKAKTKDTLSMSLCIGGNTGVRYEFADCCHAEKAMRAKEALVGYVNQHHKIKIHTAQCPMMVKIKDEHHEQMIEVTYMP